MPTFNYVAKDSQGQLLRAGFECESRMKALQTLRRKGLTVVDLQGGGDEDGGGGSVRVRRRGAEKPIHGSGTLHGWIGLGDIADFARLLATSVMAGIPLRDAVESIAEDVDNSALRRILGKIVNRLHDGRSFSQAVGEHERVFGPLFVSLIRSAEEAGSMPQTLNQLSFYLERSERLRRRIRSVTAYPMFILIFFCIVCIVMTLFVVPQFQEVFSEFGSQLPLLTRIVFGVNDFILTNLPWIGLGFAVMLIAFLVLRRLRWGRRLLDRVKLRLPLFGEIIRKYSIARTSRNLGIMIQGGVPVITAMEITSTVSGNCVIETAMMQARERIMAGSDISGSLRQDPAFPRLFVRMVAVGESTGRLPDVLGKLSEVYEEQVEGQILVTTALFEPIIICVFGAIVLLLVLAVYMPVFTVASKM